MAIVDINGNFVGDSSTGLGEIKTLPHVDINGEPVTMGSIATAAAHDAKAAWTGWRPDPYDVYGTTIRNLTPTDLYHLANGALFIAGLSAPEIYPLTAGVSAGLRDYKEGPGGTTGALSAVKAGLNETKKAALIFYALGGFGKSAETAMSWTGNKLVSSELPNYMERLAGQSEIAKGAVNLVREGLTDTASWFNNSPARNLLSKGLLGELGNVGLAAMAKFKGVSNYAMARIHDAMTPGMSEMNEELPAIAANMGAALSDIKGFIGDQISQAKAIAGQKGALLTVDTQPLLDRVATTLKEGRFMGENMVKNTDDITRSLYDKLTSLVFRAQEEGIPGTFTRAEKSLLIKSSTGGSLTPAEAAMLPDLKKRYDFVRAVGAKATAIGENVLKPDESAVLVHARGSLKYDDAQQLLDNMDSALQKLYDKTSLPGKQSILTPAEQGVIALRDSFREDMTAAVQKVAPELNFASENGAYHDAVKIIGSGRLGRALAAYRQSVPGQAPDTKLLIDYMKNLPHVDMSSDLERLYAYDQILPEKAVEGDLSGIHQFVAPLMRNLASEYFNPLRDVMKIRSSFNAPLNAVGDVLAYPLTNQYARRAGIEMALNPKTAIRTGIMIGKGIANTGLQGLKMAQQAGGLDDQ